MKILKNIRKNSPSLPSANFAKFSILTKIIFCATILFSGCFVASVYADELSDAERTCQLNNACGWNPNINGTTCVTRGSISISGSNAAEIIWSGLMSLGFTAEQTAGIMGNMQTESGLSPTKYEKGSAFNSLDWNTALTNKGISYGIGLIQFSSGRRVSFLNFIVNNYPDLVKYYQDKATYSVDTEELISLVGIDIYKLLVQANLEYLNLEQQGGESGHYAAFKNQSSTPEEAAKAYRTEVERGGIGTGNERAQNARAFYDLYKDYAPSSSNAGVVADTSNITIIGDSLTVGIAETDKVKDNSVTGTNVIKGLDGAYVDAKVGRQWNQGIDIIKDLIEKNKLKNNVVFALGTNSAGLTKKQVDEVVDLIGDTRQIYFITNITNQPPDKDKAENTKYLNNNTLFNNAATEYSNVKIIDFASKVINDKAKYWSSSDDIHPNTEGKNIFRNLIISSLKMSDIGSGGICSTSSGGNGSLNQTALDLAWPLGTPPSKTGCNGNRDCGGTKLKGIASTNYATALQQVYGGMGYEGQGLACNQFVATVVIYSGVDPNYEKGVTDSQQVYMETHQDKWETLGKSVDTSILKAGDILVNSTHIKMVVEDQDGVLRLAQASLGTETANIRENIGPNNFYAFRFKGN